MDSAELASALDDLTGSWKPSDTATQADLEEARLSLVDAFLSGIPPQSLQTTRAFQTRTPNGERAAIDAILREARPSPKPSVLPVLRSVTDIDPSALSGAAGMRVVKTLGPFVDTFGVTHWIDLIPLPEKIPMSSATRGVLGYLIAVPPTAKTLKAGSLWISVAALDIPLATTGAVGISFSSGSVASSGSVLPSPGGGVTIGAGGKLVLTLNLAPPAPPAGAPNIGRDATAMTLNLPAQVTIEFTEAGVAFASIADCGATVYGTSFSLKRNAHAPRLAKLGFGYVVFPCNASITNFAFASVLSSDVVPAGTAAVNGGGWALAITTAPANQLGEAASAGSIVLELGTGVSLSFGTLNAPMPLASATMVLAPGSIAIASANGPRDVRTSFSLWDPVPPPDGLTPLPAQHASVLDATIKRGAIVFATVNSAEEIVVAFGTAKANVDRPLTADGTRLPIAFGTALLGFVRSASGKSLIAEMSAPAVQERATLALENGLVRVNAPSRGLLNASFSGARLVGTIEFTFDNATLLPTLPDPYAAAGAQEVALAGTVSALATWTLLPGATLRFGVVPTPQERAVAFAPATLLDLSSNADQFGVSIGSLRERAGLTLDGMAVAIPQDQLIVYTLPGISWEPVVDDATNDWLDAVTADDGPPGKFLAKTVNLVRTEPMVALSAFAESAAKSDTFAQFTLPFGLIANLEVTAQDPPAQRPSYSFVKGEYDGLSASRQLSIRAQSTIAVGDPALPGYTTTAAPLPVPVYSDIYGVAALGDDPLGAAQFFDQQFSAGGVFPQIPVKRIDVSGYGTSMFSDWKNLDFGSGDPLHGIVGVVRTRFDVLLGRTSYELVQIATVIIPWSIRITRTIIFDRFDNGLVVRHDTGWKAVGTGAFGLLGADQRLTGALDHLENIHNIQVGTGDNIAFLSPDVREPIPPSQPPPLPVTPLRSITFVPVTFDADAILTPAVTASANGSLTSRLAGTQFHGYAQLTVGQVASALEILDAMQRVPDGVSGLAGCVLNVGAPPTPASPKFSINVSSIAAKVTNANVNGKAYPAVAVALNGTPRLPRDGAWSVSRRGKTDATPTPVDPSFPVPVIFGTNNDGVGQWRLLDAADALAVRDPQTIFGLLQSIGTAKSLFENPLIAATGDALSLDPAQGVPLPSLADVGSLLGASGIFPDLSNALQIPSSAADALKLLQDGFRKTYEWDVEKSDHSFLDDRTLLDAGVVSLRLQYHGPDDHGADKATHAKLVIDANPPAGSPRWSLSLERLTMAAFVTGFGTDALLSVHGGFSASETQKPGFNNIAVDYGSALSMVKSIISGLTTLIEAMGGSVDLDVGFSDNKLTVRDGFALPTIPLGLGEIDDVAIDLGMDISIPVSADFHVELGSKEKPFTWIVDPLAGTGAIVLGTQDGKLGVFIEAGIGAALDIDLAIASGGASIVMELAISTEVAPFQLTATLVGNAHVDVLDGLASASLTLAASIGITPHFPAGSPLPNEVDFTAAVAVGIHLSIAWVVSVDFDGSWSFTEDIPLHVPLL